MAKVFIEESTLTDIGNAIRGKTGKTAKISPTNMPAEIASISTGSTEPKLQEKYEEVTTNGDIDIKPDEGYDGIKRVMVSVAVPEKKLQVKDLAVTENGYKEIKPDTGYDGLMEVYVDVNVLEKKLQDTKTINITENGSYDVTPDNGYDGLEEISVNVNIEAKLQEVREWDFTANGTYNLQLEQDYDGFKGAIIKVNVPTSGGEEVYGDWMDAEKIELAAVTYGSVHGAKRVKLKFTDMTGSINSGTFYTPEIEVPPYYAFDDLDNGKYYIGKVQFPHMAIDFYIDELYTLYSDNPGGYISGAMTDAQYCLTMREA